MSELHSSPVMGCTCPFCTSARLHDAGDDGIPAGADETGYAITGGANAAKPVFSLSQIATQLRTQWGGSQEGKTWTWIGTNDVTYSMPDAGPAGRSESSGLVLMTALMKDRARLAFELWDDVIAISLTESLDNVNANITFNYSSQTSGGGTYATWTGYFYGSNFGMSRAYIWANSTWSTHDTDADMVFGGYGFITYLHEIGHSLGLSHAGTYNAGQGSLSYASSAEYFQDTRKYTVMSYWDADEAEAVDHYGMSGAWRYASAPLLHDILAAQAAYGADLTTRTGNTIYGFNSNADRAVFDFTVNRDPIIAIWDAGGTDTLDCSGFSTDQFLDLRAGAYSDVGYLTDNVAIAYGATIENAIAGAGRDILVGNSANNILTGGAGADTYVFSAAGWGTDIVFDIDRGGRIVFSGVSDVSALLRKFTGSVSGTDLVLTSSANGSQIIFQGSTTTSGWTFGYCVGDDYTASAWTEISFQQLNQLNSAPTISVTGNILVQPNA